ncbi:kinase-like protein [Thozetella sp. PMI_491]|nr:kinase-like protein [Thozetella sp. PMI_491]
MPNLREDILALRYPPQTEQTENDAGPERCFIPHQSLFRLLTEERILEAVNSIDEAHLEWHLKERTVGWILESGRVIFGILVVLERTEFISEFTQHSLSNEKLPLADGVLNEMVPSIAREFFEQQWEFTAPQLARDVLHRVLHPRCRLPYTYNEQIDEGGFGKIYKITVHPDHQMVPLLSEGPGQEMVRKEFKILAPTSGNSKEDEEDHDNEMRCLSILNELKHPNIIHMLGSYTHNERHNLLFPHVRDGNLENLLRSPRYEQFRLDETFLTALCELSSAISDVHWYTLAKLNIEMVGFHHDLKPKNILVRGSTFVLADFGLSRLQKASERPKSMFEGGAGMYLAPECEDCDAEFEKHSVSRSSDIWSFGCIMAEILTFMQKGTEGLEEFRLKRKVKIGAERIAAFHAGIRTPNRHALDWIEGRKGEPGHFSGPLVGLILSMLDMQPENRPGTREVAPRLRFITVQAHASLVGALYDQLVGKLPNSFDAFSECSRFKSWRMVFDDAVSDDDIWSRNLDARMELMSIIRCLERIREELGSVISRCENALSPLFITLRRLSDELFGFLPRDMQMQAKARWEMDMVSSEELDKLEEMAKAFENSLVDNRIGRLARIKRMSIEAAKQNGGGGADDGLEIDSQLYQINGSCGHHTLALLPSEHPSEANDAPGRRVLIEWIRYSKHETENFPRLLARIKALASLLNSFPGPDDFRTLRCSAFTHDRGECAFGLIYNFPSTGHVASTTTATTTTTTTTSIVPKTLADVISETQNFRERPTLESRLRLARTLALSIAGFHNVGWLHKSISPHNILFFLSKTSRAATWVEQPYLTGFNHSRQDDPLAFTVGPTSDAVARRYHHPEYSKMGFGALQGTYISQDTWYRLEFDYYSLGLVLLEVGLWKPLDGILKKEQAGSPLSNENALQVLREKKVPLLAHYMGSDYQDAVMACLGGLGNTGGVGEVAKIDAVKTLQIEFEKRVVEPLGRWSVSICNDGSRAMKEGFTS